MKTSALYIVAKIYLDTVSFLEIIGSRHPSQYEMHTILYLYILISIIHVHYFFSNQSPSKFERI